MGQSREALIAKLVTETGLNDSEARRFLNALTVCMNEDLERSNRFSMPGVGTLTRTAKASGLPDAIKVYWPELEPDPFTGIRPAPALLAPDAVIPGIGGIVGPEPYTGIKPPVAEPPPGVLPLDEEIALDTFSATGSEPGSEPGGTGDGLRVDNFFHRKP